MSMKPMNQEQLRKHALRTGAALSIDGKKFNTEGVKIAEKKPVDPPEKKVEAVADKPVEKTPDTVALVAAMLGNTIKEVAQQQGLDHAVLISAIAKLQPKPKPVYTSIVPIRNKDGTVQRYELKTQ